MTINPHHHHEIRQNFFTRTVGFEGKGVVRESSTSRLEKPQPGTIAADVDLESTVEPFLADDDSMTTGASPSSHIMFQRMSNHDHQDGARPRAETVVPLMELSAAPFKAGTNHNNNNSDTSPANVSCLLQLHDLLIREEPLKYSIAASAPATEQEQLFPEQRQEEGEEAGDYDDDCLSSYDSSADASSGPPAAKRPKPTHPVVHSSWSPMSPQHPPPPQETVPTRLPRKNNKNKNSKNSNKKRRGGIVFNETVRVVPIPQRTEYSPRVRHRIWSNSDEIQENAVRNTIEFASEGWDWRAVLLDDDMHLCRTTGELIHPIHYEPHRPTALALQHEHEQQQQQQQEEQQQNDIDDGATADSVDSADSSTATVSSCGGTSVASSCSSEETTATTTTTMTICSYADEY
jgi:hypothetical protein